MTMNLRTNLLDIWKLYWIILNVQFHFLLKAVFSSEIQGEIHTSATLRCLITYKTVPKTHCSGFSGSYLFSQPAFYSNVYCTTYHQIEVLKHLCNLSYYFVHLGPVSQLLSMHSSPKILLTFPF